MGKHHLVNFFSEQYGHTSALVVGNFSSVADVIAQGWHLLGQSYIHADGVVFENVSAQLNAIGADEQALSNMTVNLDPRLYRTRVAFKGVEEITEEKYRSLEKVAEETPDCHAYII